jgi:Aspartyl protease
LRFPYKNYPNNKGGFDWWALLPVQISNHVKHSPPTKRFEALVDTGASNCIFHASMGEAIGIDVDRGKEDQTVGVSGKPTTVYLHDISLHVPGGHIFKIRASFSYDLPIAGILGRNGFLEHFKVLFDPSGNPAGFDIERFYVR